jgi:hypothetical protein
VETFEHATKLKNDGLITRSAVQLMELCTELEAAVRSIANDPFPRDLVHNKFELS